MSTLAVVIPVYKDQFPWHEEASIKQAIKVLHGYDHILVTPNGYSSNTIQSWYENSGKKVIVREFDSSYFESTETYNKLMLWAGFYKAFFDYEYILIYQPDAWIYKDDLSRWMKKQYDYVGAPWVNWIHASYRAKNSSFFKRIFWRLGRRNFNAVGNGGLSLRKVATMLALLEKLHPQALNYNANEDFFFSFEVACNGMHISIPSVKEALSFAFDENPEEAFSLSGNKLPMGCHGWHKHLSFYKSININFTVQ